MTERSRRRSLEMRVIDAAIDFIRWGPFTMNPGRPEIAYADLEAAVKEYTELGLAEATGTPTRYTAPKTSHEAAEWLATRVDKPLGRIFAAVLASEYYEYEGGLTVDQIEQRLDLSHQTVSARVNQLRDSGYFIDSGKRRPTRSGRDAIVWRASSLAKAASREVPEWGWRHVEPCERG